jgi:hypothetical protein
MSELERYDATPNNVYLNNKWRTLYDGISRANDLLRILPQAADMSEESKARVRAEARFLRGHFHFDAVQMWGKVPYVDETVSDFYDLDNSEVPWEQIEADFQAAISGLPETQEEVGRATSWAAKAYLAKVHLFQQEFQLAKPNLDDILDQGSFALMDCYHDNFRIAGNNNRESIFEIQASVNDGTNGENGNFGESLNFPYRGGPGTCCGFHQPSQNLVNAHRTDEMGLPYLASFNQVEVTHDQGLASNDLFDEYRATLDPRLDWSVGRRGIPYLDWGDHPGADWIRDQAYGGPYSPKKNVYYQSEEGSGSTETGWARGANANNTRLIRLAHVILWRAEIAAAEGETELAMELVNRLRTRARDGCWVLEGGVPDDGSHLGPNGEVAAAAYRVEPYSLAEFQQDPLAAIQFESRLEFAMEGNRFFDLVRWGDADEVLSSYLTAEQSRRSYLEGATFLPNQDTHFPIPQAQLNLMENLKQNPGY